MVPPVIFCVHFGPPYFLILIVAGAGILGWEWRNVTQGRAAWIPAGLAYAALPAAALIWLRGDGDSGRMTIYWLFAIVWSADSAAYLCGRAIGGPKLAPQISPKKTWAGFIGGVSIAGLIGLAVAAFGSAPLVAWGAAGLAVAVASQLGDLAESALKRHFGVKDASGLIPGHGGLMDRVDGLVVGALLLALLKLPFGETVLAWP